MQVKRLPFVVVGIVIAGLAVLLVLWGLSALRSEPDGANGAIAEPASETAPVGDGTGGEESRPWQAFTGGAAESPEQAAALRPIERLERAAGKPFDQAYIRKHLNRLGLHLEGIGRGEQPLALIFGRVVRIGDLVEGYRVASIERTGVVLIGPNGMRIDLSLQQRSATQGNQSAGSDDYGGGQQMGVWRSEDGLRPRTYMPDGTLDFLPGEPNLRIREKRDRENLPYDRFTPWPHGPFPQAPSSYIERARREEPHPGKAHPSRHNDGKGLERQR